MFSKQFGLYFKNDDMQGILKGILALCDYHIDEPIV